ncbi:SDR family NAD(P)-dependent oxidoreductase [Candidatus Uabimicrobium amorphum]|uniref:Short-chain dehydrogenase n=1 Tax=Uabimicrobium amorphum TaxID=2596890 RepID=A0A5S9ILH2_UABAM|nr:SDR family oxidoreductase [Candidatus Uabimicrobium amorphum]BBM83240.1 short-chain dehydrogenase [Candidatus Uabimicrobium amorphum]
MCKTAIVTGASSGIGYEFCKILNENGYEIFLIARNEQKLRAVAAELRKAHVIVKDLSKENSAQEIFSEINNTPDVLINNAGFGDHGEFSDASWGKLQQMIQVNITALTELTHLFLPGMLEKKTGKIVNVASTASFQAGPLMAIYYASKAYVLHFSEALAHEIKGRGVTVTTLCPGPTASDFQRVAQMKDEKLVAGENLPSSRDVAIYGYKAMMKGKSVAVHGWTNKLMSCAYRFLPRKVITAIVGRVQASRG